MQFRDVLITGGAGFVGGSLARLLAEHYAGVRVTALDSLKRRGSELSLPGLRQAGVRFVHGDVRCPADLEAVGEVDLLIDCAAEPSVSAGLDGRAEYLLGTNLQGTLNCLELARQRGAAFLFLSTSRVYPIAAINALPYRETETRFEWDVPAGRQGVSARGIREDFPLHGARSLYGASKLAAELVLAEYVHGYGMKALVNRCGVIAGPGQLSRVDQGVITYFLACHYYQRPLAYIGWGGSGKQVRDVLHVQDLFALLQRQLGDLARWDGSVYNVGGGPERSLSLRELASLCRELTGKRIELASRPETSPVDVRIYISDNAKVERAFGFVPSFGLPRIAADIHAWIDADAQRLEGVLA